MVRTAGTASGRNDEMMGGRQICQSIEVTDMGREQGN